MHKRRTPAARLLGAQARRTGTLLAALSAAAVTSVGIAMAMGGGAPALVEHTSEMTLEPTSTTTTTEAAPSGPEVTSTTSAGERAELAAARAEVAAERAEKAAETAEGVVAATTTTTTIVAEPATTTTTGHAGVTPTTAAPATTTTTIPPVYGWVDVLSISSNGSWEVTLAGGPVRARDPKSTLKPMPLSPAGTLTLDDVRCDVQNGFDGDCLWAEAPAAGHHVVRLDGATRFSEPVVVQEYRQL